MKTPAYSAYHTTRSMVALALLAALARLAAPAFAADWPKPVVSPKTNAPSLVSGASATASSATASSATALSGSDSRRLLLLPPLIDLMQKGQLTPQRAWGEKLIDVDDLMWLLGSYIEPWGGLNGKINDQMRRGLAAVLIEHGTDKLQSPEKLRPALRLWLADYYGSLPNEKCILLCESILDEIKPPVKADDPLVFQALFRMGWYYGAVKQYEKGTQAFLRTLDYYPGRGQFQPDALLEAARLYRQAGQEQKAQETYAKIAPYGVGWYTAMAVEDDVRVLVGGGKVNEAKQLLAKAIHDMAQGEGSAVIYTFRAMLENESGERDAAFKDSEAALSDFNKISFNGRWRALFDAAQKIYNQNGGWKTQSVSVEKPSLNILFDSTEKPAIGRFRVASHGDPDIEVTCDNPLLKVHLAPLDGWDDAPVGTDNWNKEVIIEVSPEVLAQTVSQPFHATVILSSKARTARARQVSIAVMRLQQKS